MAPNRPDSPHEIGQRLRLTREALGLSQAELCRRTGIRPAAWNNAETGDNRIGIESAVELCKTTGVTLDCEKDITLKAKGALTIEADGEISIKGQKDVAVEATGGVGIKGQKDVAVEATGKLSAKGNPIHLNP